MMVPSEGMRAEIQAQLISSLYKGTASAVSVHVVLALVLAYMLSHVVEAAQLVVWGGALVSVFAVRVWVYTKFTAAAPSAADIRPWWLIMLVTAFLTGLAWGGAAWVFLAEIPLDHQLFLAMIFVIITTGAMSYLYPVPSVFLAFIVPVMGLFLTRSVQIGGDLHGAVATAAALLWVLSVYFVKRHRDELVQSLELREQYAAVLKELAQENKEVRSDYSETHKMEVMLRQKTAVLNAVSRVQGLFIANCEPRDIFEQMLQILIELTDSSFGFIGELVGREDGDPYLKIFAITDQAKKAIPKADQGDLNLQCHDPKTVLGYIVNSGEPILSNDKNFDLRCEGLPKERPNIKGFMGVPLYIGNQIAGIFCIANRAKGYDIELLTALEPVITAAAQMIDALQSRRARAETQEQLERAKEQAESANKAKTEFLSSMSHELRTPMNAVLGFAQLMQYNPKVPLHPVQADHVEQIIKAGNHLLELINEVLDLSRIEAGRVNLSVETLDIHEVAEDCIAYISPLAARRGLELSADIPAPGQISVSADRMRFRQVLLNLLSNAVKYNVHGGSVELLITHDEQGLVRCCVIDDGPGIDKDKQEEMFEPFSRLGAECTDIEGTGIGLTISRKLTQLMGGQLGFESELGKGSKFWVDLPSVETELETPLLDRTSNTLPPLPSGRHKVLYVEDNPDNLRLMEHVIPMLDDAHLISAHTGELGVEMAEVHHPDVILMDVHLPGIDGFEALKRIRGNEHIAKIPVIAISADAMSADIERGLAAGFDAYLTKPIDLKQVVESISAVLEKSKPLERIC
jgi:signal transduction histidine kinase/ActR/RegA family two-component response regulator